MQNKNKKTKQTFTTQQPTQKMYSLEDYRKQINRRSHTTSQKDTSTNPYRKQYTSEYTYTSNPTPSPQKMRQEIKDKNKLSRKEILRQKKRLKRLAIRRLAMLGIMVSFLAYGSIKMIDLFRYPAVSYQTIQEGVIDTSTLRDGLIVREETVVSAQHEGVLHYIIGEGEKVAKNGEVCFVAEDVEVKNTLNKLEHIDKKLYSIQEKRSDRSYYQPEIHHLNKAITEEMRQFYTTRYWEQPRAIYTLKKELERVIQNRTSIYMEDTTFLTEGLQEDRNELQAYLNNILYTARATQSAIVSYIIDGYESLNFDTVNELGQNTFKKAVQDAKKLQVVTTNKGSAGEPLYKLIDTKKWGIVTYIHPDELNTFAKGKSYPIYFPTVSDQPISFQVAELTPEEKGIRMLLTSNEQMADFLGKRHISFTIGQNKAEGLKIPLSAIVERNLIVIDKDYVSQEGRDYGVHKQTESGTVFTPINVQFSDDKAVYVLQEIDKPSVVQLGQVIKHPDTDQKLVLNTVETIQGVYVINGSYAKFRRIHIALQNEAYAILTNDEKTTVKAQDQMISNPKNIRENQLLKYMDVQNK